MGTRADFYIGRGQDAEWLGSVAWDGSQWDAPDEPLMNATTPEAFGALVAAIAVERDDFTRPDQGWPWPWEDSRTTDYAYVLHDGKVTAYCFGKECFVNEDDEMDCRDEKVDWFPNMSARKNVTLGPRSGILAFGVR